MTERQYTWVGQFYLPRPEHGVVPPYGRPGVSHTPQPWPMLRSCFGSDHYNLLLDAEQRCWIVRAGTTREIEGQLVGAQVFRSYDAAVAALALGFRL